MKTLTTIIMFAGFIALPAQAQQYAGWITSCGNAEYNAFGTAECPTKEVGDFMQTLETDYFSFAEAGLDTRAISKAIRLLGKAVSNKATYGGCRDEDIRLVLQSSQIWNQNVTLPANASEVQTELFDYLGQIMDNGAEFVSEGC